MKLRHSASLLLSTILILVSTFSVNAGPAQQTSDDPVIQALNAAAEELGLSRRAEVTVVEGVTAWMVMADDGDGAVFLVTTSNVMLPALAGAAGLIGGEAEPLSFYGYEAYHLEFFVFVNNINGYYLTVFPPNDTLAQGVRYAEIFLRHAEASGITGPGSTPAVTETLLPELTLTPEPGGQISLRAYAENYDQVAEHIDNSDNIGSVDISGKVTDLDTGAAIEGAVVEIFSGAASSSTLSGADGSYALTAFVSGGEGSGTVEGLDFALPVNADLDIEVTPGSTELLADGSSTSQVTIQVKDLQGNPLKDRVVNLSVSADSGPGTLQPEQAATDENGMIQATYTSFKGEAGFRAADLRHEVTITAKDTASGVTGTNWLYVNQYQLSVINTEYIPACTRCSFPSKFTILVTDYWNNPVANTPLILQVEGGISGGILVEDPNSNTDLQEISITTDSNGRATAYFKWQGSQDIVEAEQKVTVIDGVTNTQVAKVVKVQGIDISLDRVKEAGFTGVTGQQAFLKVYFKELTHPDLPLERFNADSPNKLSLRVTISQYHSDGTNTSVTYENYGGWERDAGGLYVKMYGTPHMPYIIPMNDGNSWYEIRVDPVIDGTIDLPDRFRPNNDTILVLKTGSPDGWLHIWLQDGILTPHNWAGVVFKCVGRFLPVVGQAMTVIDTLNQTYKMDVLGLGQSTTQVLADALENKSTLLTPTNNALKLTRTAAFNNVISCMQDIYSVSKEGSAQSSTAAPGRSACAALVRPQLNLIPFALDESDFEQISVYQDRFAQGLLLDSPEERGVVVYGVEASDVTLRDASGTVFDDPELMSAEGRLAIYILPVNETFQLEVASDHDFDVAVYEAGSDQANRITLRHSVQTDTGLTANLAVGGTSDYSLGLDLDDDGVFDQSLSPQATILDVLKPQISGLYPEENTNITEEDFSVFASYADNPGGTGIDTEAIIISVDGFDRTPEAFIQPGILSLDLPDLTPGEHIVRLVVSDLDGNAAVAEWSFTFQGEISDSPDYLDSLLVNGIGALFILLVGTILAFAFRRRQRRPWHKRRGRKNKASAKSGTIQDQHGELWYQDPTSKEWQTWNGEVWEPAQGEPELTSKGKGCLISLIIAGISSVLVFGWVTLVAFNYFPRLSIPPASTISLLELLKNGGAGLLVSLVGVLLLRGGFNALTSRRVVVEDESGKRREKRGCLAVISGLGSISLGLIILLAGLGWLALALYQHGAPLLGYPLV